MLSVRSLVDQVDFIYVALYWKQQAYAVARKSCTKKSLDGHQDKAGYWCQSPEIRSEIVRYSLF